MMNFESLKGIYANFVEKGPLEYLLVNKLSQDHLEHFFGRYDYYFILSIHVIHAFCEKKVEGNNC